MNINNDQFEHNILIENNSFGCPILLLNNNNINLIQVIGINKTDESRKLNKGTFIGEMLNEINRKLNDEKKNKNNFIIAEIDINDKKTNKDIRIINSYNEYLRTGKNSKNFTDDSRFYNENEIKNCEIRISDFLIPFNYTHQFKSKGRYIIKYSFKNTINNASFMFGDCQSLTNIDLTNFNAQNITDMGCMLYGCSSLTNLKFFKYQYSKCN
jgi:surface protein